MIHVCFSIHTHYKLMGTAMLSIFENTNSKVTVHIFHENILMNDTRDKFIQIADRYGQQLKFYNVEELCVEELAYLKECYLHKPLGLSMATFYKIFFPQLLLPQGIEKAIYIDSDIIVNLDIAELWQVELGDKPFAAVSEYDQHKDKNFFCNILRKQHATIVKNLEDYFNGGLLLMNLPVLRNEEATIKAGMKFIGEQHPKYPYYDQDILNYCFSTRYLKLPVKFNKLVFRSRMQNDYVTKGNMCHYAGKGSAFIMDSRDPYSRLFMDYFIKTPWVDADKLADLSGAYFSSRKNYAVSVIIPMYNAAEFIGECLDSLLAQTFQNFEVIVVDDCSTDNSVEIVEEYAPKFNGRLRLEKTEKNSNTSGNVPRNIGVRLAQGDYIQFLDADDMILTNALETLYKAAIFYEPDVVYTAFCYLLNAPNDISLYRDGAYDKTRRANTSLSTRLSENLNLLLFESGEGNFHNCWTKFVRRDFLTENKIVFPRLSQAGDFIWVIEVYCHAKNLLRITTPLYLHRTYKSNSASQMIRPPQEQYLQEFSSFVEFAKRLYELERENNVLANNPLYCLAALKKHFPACLNQTENAGKGLDSEEFFKVLRSGFDKNFSYSIALLLPFLFNFIIERESSFRYFESIINKFNCYFTARIRILLVPKTDRGDLQIVSASDDKAQISKFIWKQQNIVGYSIQSLVGKIEFVVKATTDGRLNFFLSGVEVRHPEDNKKHIPYWIDYTQFVINDGSVFDTVKSAWFERDFRYGLEEIKAGEEIKIQVEWLPHRSDT